MSLFSSDLVFTGLPGLDARSPSKEAALTLLAQLAASRFNCAPGPLVHAVLQRERLGNTALGLGVALPQAKSAWCPSVTAVFVRLGAPLDYDGFDRTPVDMLCALFAPPGAAGDHLQALNAASRLLRDELLLHRLRKAADAASLYALLAAKAERAAA